MLRFPRSAPQIGDKSEELGSDTEPKRPRCRKTLIDTPRVDRDLLDILMFQDFTDMRSIRLLGESEIRDEAKQAGRCVAASWSVEFPHAFKAGISWPV